MTHHLEVPNVRIISLNAWGGARYAALADWLPVCAADVLCLQEVTRTPGLGGWTRFDDADRSLPQRANLFDDVRSLLPRHQATFLTSDSGPVCAEDGTVHRQDFGTALFVAEDVPVVGHHAAFVHGAYADHEVWPTSGRPRLAHAVNLVGGDAGGGPGAARTVTVTHLHGLRDASGKQDTPARRVQAERLADLVHAARRPGDLAVVCGDLNLLPTSETFDVLGGVGLRDLVGDADTRTSHYTKPVRHASYLLVSDPAAVARFEVIDDPEVSDHRPLAVEV